MKKIFLIIVMTSIVATTWAQQLSTIRGKTKDNKTLTVQYYPGTFEDRIESVKYQVVDELQNNVKTLQNNVKDLQNRLDAANKQVKQLSNDLKKSSSNGQVDPAFQQQLEAKEAEVALLTSQIDSLGAQLLIVNKEKAVLQLRLDSVTNAFSREQDTKESPSVSAHYIGIEAGIGPTLMGSGLNAPWAKDITWDKQLALCFGTKRFAESLPLSAEVGIGIHQLPISARIYQYDEKTEGWIDNDGDVCTAHYSFDNLNERLTTTIIGIPIRLCIGQPFKGKTKVYAKLGVTPSLVVASKFSREGKYSLKGEYPQWDVTLENIEELGFHTNAEFDGIPAKVKASGPFNLWGNFALGTYIPIGSSISVNAGIKIDYPITGTANYETTDGSNLNIQGWDGLLNTQQKNLIASFEIGLVYNLK